MKVIFLPVLENMLKKKTSTVITYHIRKIGKIAYIMRVMRAIVHEKCIHYYLLDTNNLGEHGQ